MMGYIFFHKNLVTLVLLGEFKNIRNNNRKLYTQMSEPNIFVDTI